MGSRDDLKDGEALIEAFLTHLAMDRHPSFAEGHGHTHDSGPSGSQGHLHNHGIYPYLAAGWTGGDESPG